ncbi:MAG: 2-deoxynucleoside 5-phosphate N-hydrolase [Desulfuromonadales bacterium]|nr:2-deoxynucleoside 5-phosphate N-hydrolase [Desulfuromonadales bacterium]
MKAFFSGSIRGGNKYRSSYLKILAFLKHYGDIISEHSSQQKDCDDQGLSGDGAIYARDIRWIGDADLLIAEVSQPSIGVGYEIAYAEARDIPVLALYHLGAETPMSAMISGNPRITSIRYRSLSELWPLLKEKLAESGF